MVSEKLPPAKSKEKDASSKRTSPARAQQEVVKIFGYRARRKTKLHEYIALAVSVTFAAVIAGAAWYTEGEIFSSAWNAVMRYEAAGNAPRDLALNCRNPKNRNTPYCANREQQIRQTWNGITRNQDGRQPAFSLHGKGG